MFKDFCLLPLDDRIFLLDKWMKIFIDQSNTPEVFLEVIKRAKDGVKYPDSILYDIPYDNRLSRMIDYYTYIVRNYIYKPQNKTHPLFHNDIYQCFNEMVFYHRSFGVPMKPHIHLLLSAYANVSPLIKHTSQFFNENMSEFDLAALFDYLYENNDSIIKLTENGCKIEIGYSNKDEKGIFTSNTWAYEAENFNKLAADVIKDELFIRYLKNKYAPQP